MIRDAPEIGTSIPSSDGPTQSRSRGRIRRFGSAALVLAVAVLALTGAPSAPARAEADARELTHDHGGLVIIEEGPYLLPLFIPFSTDCLPDEQPPSCGPPAGRWTDSTIPIEFCTAQLGRPSWIGAATFRDAVAQAAEAWNALDSAVGVRYTGDCGGGWEQQNGQNEIGFDDERRVADGDIAGLTISVQRWSPAVMPVVRAIVEADIIMNRALSIPAECFVSTMAHEMGHALGLGHSDDPSDLMYPSFIAEAARCRHTPSPAEAVRMQELYGVDRAPTADAGTDAVVDADTTVALLGSGDDPEGQPLTFAWRQLSGPSVTLQASGASASFTSPAAGTEPMVFELTARDPFLHPGIDTVTVTVGDADAPPALPPSFASFLPAAGGAELGWKEVTGASSYRFCSNPAGLISRSTCSDRRTATALVDWDLTPGSSGPSTATRLFSDGLRATSLSACNSKGCSRAGVGPLAGGLRWSAWRMDYDFFAMAFDFGRLRYTIVGVVNVSGPRRAFTLYTGPVDDPLQQRIVRCGTMVAGQTCVDFLGPADDHFATATIVSTGVGTPTTEHRIRIR